MNFSSEHKLYLRLFLFNFVTSMKLVNHILSAKFMAVLLFIMAAAIGVATFIENEFDTITAKELVYNAKWFELVLLLLMLNFINNIKTYQLLKWNKWSVLLLHLDLLLLF